MFKQLTLTASLVVAALFSGHALAETATNTFQVKMTILKSCSVAAGASSDIALGPVTSTAINTAGSNTISVTCSKDTGYSIGLTPSNGDLSGAGAMSSGSLVPVPYQLHSGSATGPAWGSTSGAVAGTGNGTAQSHQIFAVAPSANYTPGSYADTVTVTVTY